MDLLTSTVYSWEEGQPHIPKIRSRAIQQFVSWYEQVRDHSTNQLLWGDETEYMIVVIDSEKKQVKLSLSAHAVLERIRQKKTEKKILYDDEGVTWNSEYANFMIEGTPSQPYDATIDGLLKVEPIMKSRKAAIQRYLTDNGKLITLSSYPRLGVDQFSLPYYRPKNDEHGDSISNDIIFPEHHLYQGSHNINRRRGECRIHLPIYNSKDIIKSITSMSYSCISDSNGITKEPIMNENILLDNNAFGFGCCCLQVTFQATDINEALYLHDQLATIAPLMLALTAATPVFKGYLCNTDCRWYVLSYTLDDRTADERNSKEDQTSFIPQRARYGSISRYVSNTPECKPEYNDVKLRCDEEAFEMLSSHGMDEPLARYYAHIFTYDPLFIPKSQNESNNIKKDSYKEAELLFGRIWPSIRIKIPPVDNTMGWRVEFRTMEIQPNDFENAAFAVVMNLLVRTILNMQLNFLIPISKIDDNMERAQLRDAARQQKFWFRKHIFSQTQGNNQNGNSTDIENEYTLLSLDQIFNGEPNVFIGLIPLIHQYLDGQELNTETREQLNKYLDLVQNKANGTKLTTAQLIRKFVINHPNYQHDSYVDDLINYDLVKSLF